MIVLPLPLVTHGLDWRLICARRARKLRRRGEHVQFDHNTSTGKARYRWLMR